MKTPSSPPSSTIWRRPPWKYLISLNVGITLLVLLTGASIIGTLISPLERAQEMIYYSWWFEALLLLVVVNITATTIHRIVYRILPGRRIEVQRAPQFYEMAKPTHTSTFKGTAEAVAAAFSRRGFRTAVDGPFGCARKGGLGRWGSAIAHLGVVTVLVSSFAAGLVSREADVEIGEGETVDTMYLRTATQRRMTVLETKREILTKKEEQRQAHSQPASPDTALQLDSINRELAALKEANPSLEVPMGFAIRCDDFETGFFPKTGIPSNFVSSITVLEKERAVQSARVEVNHTLKTHGWIVHQTNYREIKGGKRYRLSLHRQGSTTMTVNVSPGQTRPIPDMPDADIQLSESFPLAWRILRQNKVVAEGSIGTGQTGNLRLRAEQFEPDFVIGPEHKATSRSGNLNNPALHVALLKGSEQVAIQWLFTREEFKAMHRAEAGYNLELVKITGQAPNWKFHVSVQTAEGTPLGEYVVGVGGEVPIAAAETRMPTPAARPTGEWDVRLLGPVKTYVTTLTLTRNPVIPIIYLGCAIIVLGLLVAFLDRRKTIHFWVNEAKGQLRVVGVYRLPQTELDRSTRRAIDEITATGSPR